LKSNKKGRNVERKGKLAELHYKSYRGRRIKGAGASETKKK